jgi:hypothetical protein
MPKINILNVFCNVSCEKISGFTTADMKILFPDMLRVDLESATNI